MYFKKILLVFMWSVVISSITSGCGSQSSQVGHSETISSSSVETAGSETSTPQEASSEQHPEDIVPEIMSPASGEEVLTGLQQGQPAPYSGVLLNSFAAAWLESEPDATQERCQLFVNRRLGEVRAVYGARVATLQLNLDTQERVQTIELQNRDLQLTSLREQNATLRNASGNWWEQVLWIGGSLLVGTALGIVISAFAN